MSQSLPEVDQFLSTDELLRVGDFSGTSAECLDASRKPYFIYDENMSRLRNPGEPFAYVKIAEGCDRPCSFCIIPKLRGPYRSRSVESVTAEARALLASGVQELNLVAQDLTAFGSERGKLPKSSIVQLLQSLSALYQGGTPFWLRLLYAYPAGVSDELLDLLCDSPVLCKYLDLPLQHISAGVLKRMSRPLGEKRTRQLIERIRKRVPNIALRTTFLLGFPGETEKDVRRLEEFVREGHFTHVGAFAYSPEPEAKSDNLPDQIPEEERENRRGRIMASQQELVFARLANMIGQKEPVLVLGAHLESELLLSARARWQAPETDGEIIINELEDELLPAERSDIGPALQGRFAQVEFTGSAGYDLLGKLIALY